MDSARFKLPPHWAPVQLLFEAMQPPDPSTGKTRGWALLKRQAAAPLLLLELASFAGGGSSAVGGDVALHGGAEDPDGVKLFVRRDRCQASALRSALRQIVSIMRQRVAVANPGGHLSLSESEQQARADPAIPTGDPGRKSESKEALPKIHPDLSATDKSGHRIAVRAFVEAYLIAL